jgi:hypothetical protein
MQLDRVLDILNEVPDYQVFLTVDELNQSTFRLAKQYPDVVECLDIGRSRAGDPIYALKIGSGKRNALLFAMPHPNEPIGSMMLEFLAQKLAEDKALREELDYTWYIVKCIDIDGTRLNEGWFKGPFTVANYAANYYRPPSYEQVEWTFPIEYKTLKFDTPLPETQALMGLIEDTQPDFMFSLHNAGFGGVYLYLSRDYPDFYPDFYKLVAGQQLPLHLGEPEVPFAVKFSDAVFGMIGISDNYDFLEKNSPKDPAEIMKGGSSSYEYARKFADPLFLVCEMPYFYNPAITDTTPTSDIQRDTILAGLKFQKNHIQTLKDILEPVWPLLTLENAFKETTKNTLENAAEQFAAQENWAQNAPELSRPATVAEKFDSQYAMPFYALLGLGTAVRMLKTQIAVGGDEPALQNALQALQAYFDKSAADLEKALDYQVIPIKKLAGVQLGCALLLATQYVKPA